MSASRRRLYEILEDGKARHPKDRWCDAFLITLIVVNAIAVTLETVPSIAERYAGPMWALEVFSVAVFTIEYGLRVWVARDHPNFVHLTPLRARLTYMRSPLAIVDLVAILPFYLSAFVGIDLRILRLLRVLRVLKLTRFSPALRTMARVARKESRAILGALCILVVIVMVASTVVHIIEGPGQPEVFGTIPDAMWWSIETLTTVGYGDAIPRTAAGRFVGAIVMLLGIGVFVLWTSIFAAGFLEESRKEGFVVTWQLVAKVPVLAGLDAARIAEIAELLSPETVPPRFTIIRRGEAGDSIYFIVSGDVEIDQPNGTSHLGAGHFFGEVALIEKTDRQATVTSITDCQLMRLDGTDFRELMLKEPELHSEISRVAESRRVRRPTID
jgi:voltage-gated potassium channel